MIDVALVTLLKQHAGAGDRVYAGGERVEVTRDLPKLVYTLLGEGDGLYTDDGAADLIKETCQLDAFAAKPTAARLLLDNLRVALDGYSGTVDGTRIDRIYFRGRPKMQKGEQQVGHTAAAARYTQDVIVDYREPVS